MSPVIAAQLIGAILNMGAFALLHFEIAPSSAMKYLIPNLLGSIILVVTAWIDEQWGFLLLEATWIVVLTHAIVSRKPAVHSRHVAQGGARGAARSRPSPLRPVELRVLPEPLERAEELPACPPFVVEHERVGVVVPLGVDGLE